MDHRRGQHPSGIESEEGSVRRPCQKQAIPEAHVELKFR